MQRRKSLAPYTPAIGLIIGYRIATSPATSPASSPTRSTFPIETPAGAEDEDTDSDMANGVMTRSQAQARFGHRDETPVKRRKPRKGESKPIFRLPLIDVPPAPEYLDYNNKNVKNVDDPMIDENGDMHIRGHTFETPPKRGRRGGRRTARAPRRQNLAQRLRRARGYAPIDLSKALGYGVALLFLLYGLMSVLENFDDVKNAVDNLFPAKDDSQPSAPSHSKPSRPDRFFDPPMKEFLRLNKTAAHISPDVSDILAEVTGLARHNSPYNMAAELWYLVIDGRLPFRSYSLATKQLHSLKNKLEGLNRKLIVPGKVEEALLDQCDSLCALEGEISRSEMKEPNDEWMKWLPSVLDTRRLKEMPKHKARDEAVLADIEKRASKLFHNPDELAEILRLPPTGDHRDHTPWDKRSRLASIASHIDRKKKQAVNDLDLVGKHATALAGQLDMLSEGLSEPLDAMQVRIALNVFMSGARGKICKRIRRQKIPLPTWATGDRTIGDVIWDHTLGFPFVDMLIGPYKSLAVKVWHRLSSPVWNNAVPVWGAASPGVNEEAAVDD